MKVFPKKECSICLDEISRKTIETPCGHAFCSPCYKQWSAYRLSLGDTASCPICRRELPRVEFTTRDLFELISNSRNSDVFEFAIDELYKLKSKEINSKEIPRVEIERFLDEIERFLISRVSRVSRETRRKALEILQVYRSNFQKIETRTRRLCTCCFVTFWLIS